MVQRACPQQIFELHLTQLIGKGGFGEVKHQLTEHRGSNAVGGVGTIPLLHRLQKGLLVRVGHHLLQDRHQVFQNASRIAVADIELQLFGRGDVPLGFRVAEHGIEPPGAVRQVVIAGHRHAAGRFGLVVGGHDVAARRILFLRVVVEGIKAQFFGLALGCVQHKRGIHALGTNGQLAGRPPANIARCIGPDHIEPGRVNFAGGSAGLFAGGRAVEFVKGFQNGVFGLQKRPPHGYGCAAKILLVGIGNDGAAR